MSAILEGKNYSFADVLNAYAEVMAEMHYNSEADFMVSASNATPLKVESVSEPGNIETKEMNAFGSTPQTTQVPSKTQQILLVWFRKKKVIYSRSVKSLPWPFC